MNGIDYRDSSYNCEVNSEFLCNKLLLFNNEIQINIELHCNKFLNYNFISGIILYIILIVIGGVYFFYFVSLLSEIKENVFD